MGKVAEIADRVRRDRLPIELDHIVRFGRPGYHERAKVGVDSVGQGERDKGGNVDYCDFVYTVFDAGPDV